MNTVKKAVSDAIVEHVGQPMETLATRVISSMGEPCPHAVAAAADRYGLDPVKVFAIWSTMIEETAKR